jgi:hypothetical protein
MCAATVTEVSCVAVMFIGCLNLYPELSIGTLNRLNFLGVFDLFWTLEIFTIS